MVNWWEGVLATGMTWMKGTHTVVLDFNVHFMKRKALNSESLLTFFKHHKVNFKVKTSMLSA
jgi:hypothetical protein